MFPQVQKGLFMKTHNKLTVTIGIPAYNEAENIVYLLESILRQKQESYLLKKIIVACDGCTDRTLEIIKNLAKRQPIVTWIFGKTRKGKKYRLLQLYRKNQSDIIVTFDGDVVLSEPGVIEKMIGHFSDRKVAIVGGNNQPVDGETVAENLIRTWKKLWYEVRKDANKGDHVHNVRGTALALTKSFAKSVRFQKGIVSDARMLYFQAVAQSLKFSFAKEAIVYYRLPQSIHEYILQTKKRATSDRHKLAKIYGDATYDFYKIPTHFKIKGVLMMLWKDPIFTVLACVFHLWLATYPRSQNFEPQGLWEIVQSSKRAINVSFR